MTHPTTPNGRRLYAERVNPLTRTSISRAVSHLRSLAQWHRHHAGLHMHSSQSSAYLHHAASGMRCTILADTLRAYASARDDVGGVMTTLRFRLRTVSGVEVAYHDTGWRQSNTDDLQDLWDSAFVIADTITDASFRSGKVNRLDPETKWNIAVDDGTTIAHVIYTAGRFTEWLRVRSTLPLRQRQGWDLIPFFGYDVHLGHMDSETGQWLR